MSACSRLPRDTFKSSSLVAELTYSSSAERSVTGPRMRPVQPCRGAEYRCLPSASIKPYHCATETMQQFRWTATSVEVS
jgi:hypothetical protein